MVSNLKVTKDENSLLQVEDNKVAVNVHQDGHIQDDHILVTKEQTKQSISKLIDEAIGEVLTNAENEGLADTDVRQKTVELLLEQPSILQGLISQLQIVSQKSSTDTTEQKTLDTTIDNVIKKDSLLADQQIESGGQADIQNFVS